MKKIIILSMLSILFLLIWFSCNPFTQLDSKKNSMNFSGTDGSDMVKASVAPDSYEPDDSVSQASTITDGQSQIRDFHTSSDRDVVKIYIAAGEVYRIEITPITADVVPILQLTDMDNEILHSDNDLGLKNSALIIPYITISGTYIIGIGQYANAQEGKSYSLKAVKTN